MLNFVTFSFDDSKGCMNLEVIRMLYSLFIRFFLELPTVRNSQISPTDDLMVVSIFSSPELKAQVTISDLMLPIRLSYCPSVSVCL